MGLTEKPSVTMNLPVASLEQPWRVGSSFYICFSTFLLGNRGKIAQLDEHLAWVDVFMHLGQAVGSFFSHSLKFLLATVFEPNRLRFPFRATLKINGSFGVGRGQRMEPLTFRPSCSLRRGPLQLVWPSCFTEQRAGERRN